MNRINNVLSLIQSQEINNFQRMKQQQVNGRPLTRGQAQQSNITDAFVLPLTQKCSMLVQLVKTKPQVMILRKTYIQAIRDKNI
ncbi:UNKNOWN [Stylonychia lemnae]|uniref:Uncharacterized protein n=1 Tax=Stylonychia lemnae TaxID=5949 RepID=A0A078ADE8_STYLE|nr:UNKNOWN [Stylonychia lemnae]|eukprot:CDW78873.1 UNKNOWN [Stylonychia lemnae]